MPIELTSTRLNPGVDPVLHVWGWEIPVYLFLGGLVAGMMILAAHLLRRGGERHPRTVAFTLPALSLALLSAGMLALFLDLEHPAQVWRLYTAFEPTSPMSWGAWILIAVYPALLANLLLRPPRLLARWAPVDRASRALAAAGAERVVALANLTLGALLGIYTGVLLSSLAARPLWSSALLGPLFLLSGLSSAAALAHLWARDPEEGHLLARLDDRFLVLELAALGLFLVALTSGNGAQRAAAALLLGGPWTATFWVFVVLLGIALPLVVQTLAERGLVRSTPVAPLLVLAGGALLRVVVVYAGQASTTVLP